MVDPYRSSFAVGLYRLSFAVDLYRLSFAVDLYRPSFAVDLTLYRPSFAVDLTLCAQSVRTDKAKGGGVVEDPPVCCIEDMYCTGLVTVQPHELPPSPPPLSLSLFLHR